MARGETATPLELLPDHRPDEPEHDEHAAEHRDQAEAAVGRVIVKRIDTPVAADLITRGLYVSNSPDLSAEDRALIADTLRGVARAEGLA